MNTRLVLALATAIWLLSACQQPAIHNRTPTTDINGDLPTHTRHVATTAPTMPTVPTVRPSHTPEAYEQQWYLDRIHAPIVDDVSLPSVRVAIIDTGIDTTHPDLAGQIIETIDIFAEDVMNDRQGHGTHTAGIIAAKPNAQMRTRGICVICQIIAIKAINDDGYGSDVTVAQGIDDAINAGASVINLSIGSSSDAPVIKAAIERALAADIIVVAAAGNSNNNQVEAVFPAAYPGVLAVSAIDRSNQIAPFAQNTPDIDIVAPGVEIVSTSPFGAGYSMEQGTSTAAPQVTATVALVRALRPDLSAQQIQELILTHAIDLGDPGYDVVYGHGLLRIDTVLEAATQTTVTQRGKVRGRVIGADIMAVTLELDKQPVILDANGQFGITDLAAGLHTLEIIYADSRIPLTFELSGIGLFVTDIDLLVRNGTITPTVTEQLP